jgi:hypothetical protein
MVADVVVVVVVLHPVEQNSGGTSTVFGVVVVGKIKGA